MSGWRVEAPLVALGALLIAVVTTWPLVTSLQELVHDPYDPLFQAWQLDWVQHALHSGVPLWDANIFAGNARTLAYSDAMVGAAVALLPARWLGLSPAGVLNVGVLLAYASSAIGGYVFGRVVTGRVPVAVCTAIVFGFGTYNTFLGQHLTILLHPGPALAAASVWAIADRRATGRPALLVTVGLGAVVAVQGTTSFYMFAFSAVAALVVALVRVPDLGWLGIVRCGAALAVAALALLPLAWPYMENVRSSPEDFRWQLRDLRATGADFLAVDPTLSLWGGSLGAPTGILGQPTFPGITAIVLALYGLLGWGGARDRRPHLVAVALVVVGATLAIGTSDLGWRRFAPYRLVFDYVPGGDGLRAPGRYWIVGLLGLALLVGLGVERVIRTLRGVDRRIASVVVVAVACGLVLVEGFRPWSDGARPVIPPVDHELARLPERGGVVYLPVPPSNGGGGLGILNQASVVYRSTAHRRPTPNGYGGWFPPSFFELHERLARLPDERSLSFLRRAQIRFVVVGPAAGPWQRLRDPAAAIPLRHLGRYGADVLYEVPPSRRR